MRFRTDWAIRLFSGCFLLCRRLLLLALPAALWICGSGVAQAAVVGTPQLTLVVFADKSMPDSEWAALFADLQQAYVHLALDTHSLPGELRIIRGDRLMQGIEVDVGISIFLHGDCKLLGQPGRSVARGALGWVLDDHGHIEPFIHVDCSRIGEMLGQYAMGIDRDRRDEVMAEAISRVVLHEWMHITTQSSSHTSGGISKSTFGVADLIPDYAPLVARASHGR